MAATDTVIVVAGCEVDHLLDFAVTKFRLTVAIRTVGAAHMCRCRAGESDDHGGMRHLSGPRWVGRGVVVFRWGQMR